MRITVPAYAKINLHLQILRRAADGYHDVSTVLQSLALHDTIVCETRPGPFELRCDRPGVPLDASNLVWKAARAVSMHAGLGEPADAIVTIEKQIPMQAGLGGGSADAAAALMAFARLWRVPVARDVLIGLARQLGADVAFCLHAMLEDGTPTAFGSGRGDRLTPLPALPDHAVLIVMPPFGVSTPDAYRWHDECIGERAAAEGVAEAISDWPTASSDWDHWLPSLFNDFERAVGQRFPEVTQAIEALRGAGARLAAMSGSGAALFGLFETKTAAADAAASAALPGGPTGGPTEGPIDGPIDRQRWQTILTATRRGLAGSGRDV